MPPVVLVAEMTMPAVVEAVVLSPASPCARHLIDFVLRDDRRLNACDSRHGRRMARDRRYGSSLRARSPQDRACNQSSTEIQEIPEFHDFMPLSGGEREDMQSRRLKMNVR